jgi:hypothetical protein
MLQTIEVEIDTDGDIRGSAAQALALLASPQFANRPVADPIEVQHRIENLRNDWTER